MLTSRRFVLFLASFLMLYFELALIRWVPGHVRVLAYFTNFVLIACFFGMGLGMTLTRGRDYTRWVPAGIVVLVLLTVLFKRLWVVTDDSSSFIFVDYAGFSGTTIKLLPLLVVFYIAIAGAFIPFGQLIGQSFGSPASLLDYSVNLIGSMAGILVFFAYSWLGMPAWGWFLLGMPLLILLAPTLSYRVAAGVMAAVVVALVWFVDQGTFWSPYHKIETTPFAYTYQTMENGERVPVLVPYEYDAEGVTKLDESVGKYLRINDDFYQSPVNLSDAAVKQYPVLETLQAHYNMPFRLKKHAKRVLIVGGGTGNDAAAALRLGAEHVDVVDIDPTIVELGKQYHPEKPYSDPRVTVHIDDARHFFHHAEPGYDVIVFALLDSHRLMGTLSSLRLDSYVFTLESFEEAKRLLSPESGIQVTAFAVTKPWAEARFYEMLRKVYGEEPFVATEQGLKTHSLVLVSGPGSKHLELQLKSRPVNTEVLLTSDDWPFIYATDRSISRDYLLALSLVLLLSVLVFRGLTGQRQWPDMHFFFLGAGFLLLETKNVTTLALVFGSTWYVNSVVFFAVLTMALASNAVVSLVPRIPVGLAYAGLFAAVLLNYLLPLQSFAGDSLAMRLIVVGGVTALPVFFSGIIFANSFRQAKDPAHALGSNVLGGVLGGVIEYLSLVFGLRFLFVLIAGFYVLSLLTLPRRTGVKPTLVAPLQPVGSTE